MNVEYINPFLKALDSVFKSMLNLDLEMGTPRLRDENKGFSISGVIGFTGSVRGFVVISYPKPMAVRIVSTILGMDLDEFSPYIADGIGEVTNMVVGNAQKELPTHRLALSLPNVVFGNDHRVSGTSGAPVISIPLKCGWGEFSMEVSLSEIAEDS
jgi:chemotaxis protein CheX